MFYETVPLGFPKWRGPLGFPEGPGPLGFPTDELEFQTNIFRFCAQLVFIVIYKNRAVLSTIFVHYQGDWEVIGDVFRSDWEVIGGDWR